MELEDSVNNGRRFWKMDLKGQAGHDKSAAENVLNKIMHERRAQVNLADDLE